MGVGMPSALGLWSGGETLSIVMGPGSVCAISPFLWIRLSPADYVFPPDITRRLQLPHQDCRAVGVTSPAVDSSSPRGATQQGEATAKTAGTVSAVSPAVDSGPPCRPGPAPAAKQNKPKAKAKAKAKKEQREENVDGAFGKAAKSAAAAAEQPGRPSDDLPRPASERQDDRDIRHSDGEDEPSLRRGEPAAQKLSPALEQEQDDPAAALSSTTPVEEGRWKVVEGAGKGRRGGGASGGQQAAVPADPQISRVVGGVCTADVLPGSNHLRLPPAAQEAALQLLPLPSPAATAAAPAAGAPQSPAAELSRSAQQRPVAAAPSAQRLVAVAPLAATDPPLLPPPPLLGSWAEQARRKREEAEGRRKAAEADEEEATLQGPPLGHRPPAQDAGFPPQHVSSPSPRRHSQPQAQDAGLSPHRAPSPPPPAWGDWPAVIFEAVESACPGANELDVMPQVWE